MSFRTFHYKYKRQEIYSPFFPLCQHFMEFTLDSKHAVNWFFHHYHQHEHEHEHGNIIFVMFVIVLADVSINQKVRIIEVWKWIAQGKRMLVIYFYY